MHNRLGEELSLYLRQHADNPVHWQPWSQAAFAEAAARDCPVFLSIGYSACHWCHVMAHESFESEEIAERLNRGFVCIKVDREERPDVDAVYMDAVQSMTGHGGWPLSVFLTPDGSPFHGGTYYPPTSRHGSPGFPDVLDAVRRAWDERRSQVLDHARQLRDSLQTAPGMDAPKGAVSSTSNQPAEPNREDLTAAARTILAAEDPQSGGFGHAPKFPQAPILRFLLARSARHGDPRPGQAAVRCLAGMAAGGIHDQLAGGFHRYSVDAEWTVPHFEKMLYDNALLSRAYLEGWQLTGGARLAQVALSTARYLARDLRGAHGAFLAGSDADTAGQEGTTFLWTPAELRSALPDMGSAEAAEAWYSVTAAGNFEGTTVLTARRTLAEAAAITGLEPQVLESALPLARARLLEERSTRPQPAVDDKVHVAWNALAIDALARVAAAFDDPELLDAAVAAARFVQTEAKVAGSLAHMWAGGRATVPGFLEDFAGLAGACITLFETTHDRRWLRVAEDLIGEMLDRFGREPGALARSGPDHDALFVRHRELVDSAEPSGNSLAVDALLRLFVATGNATFEDRARRILAAGNLLVRRAPMAVGALLAAADDATEGVREVTFLRPAGVEHDDLERAVRSSLIPGSLLTTDVGPRNAAVVCHGQTCGPPLFDAGGLLEALGAPKFTSSDFLHLPADPAWP